MLVMSFQILTYRYYIVTFASSVYFLLFFAEIFSSEFQVQRQFTPSDNSMSNIWDKWKIFLARVSQHFSVSRGLPYPRFRKMHSSETAALGPIHEGRAQIPPSIPDSCAAAQELHHLVAQHHL